MVNRMRPVFVDQYAFKPISRKQLLHHGNDALTDEIVADIRPYCSHKPDPNGLRIWIAIPLACQTTEIHLYDVPCGYLRSNCIEQVVDLSADLATAHVKLFDERDALACA